MADTPTNISVASPLVPITNPAWLYCPIAAIVVPVSTAGTTYYYLQEDAIGRFLTEDGQNLLIVEQNG